MNRQSILDACFCIREKVAWFTGEQDKKTFWHWARAFWYATRAMKRLGDDLAVGMDIDWQIDQATKMLEK